MSLLADMGDFLVPGRTNLNIKIRLNIVIFTNYNIINSETMFTKQARAALQIRVKAESILILMCDSNIVARLERGG
ncbi:hypothetical protein BV242_06625 [Lactiplantibacillus plantarum]|jgi:hypothetical protein|nr:hypothetical protein SH83_03365 [Lactiplantibacillus plantarum]AUV72399.1 hypothetical protein C1940_07935 [Lactiplantibacillus plantarum subsp. plantarum]EFK29793.1 hypothetical protein HMPREF0531_11045 [Lactiplantibacillus plantarum subsp. plantarum ATCC 14917 = JCM 1149 = CGMCC 1.2437]ERJ52065.1 hypothetical protein N574_11435 [Lactiplantibacillus plantarum 2165]MCS6091764.1 hypothetical protein [Lactobacillus sp. LMY-20]PNW63467.1 hypothetical protein ACZ99_07460 [Lactobacillus sp. ATCC